MKKSKKPRKNDIRAAGADPDIIMTGTVTLQAADAEKKGPRQFDMEAYFGGPLSLKGFPLPVVVDLASIRGTDKSRPVLKDHDPRVSVGHTVAISNDGAKLTASGLMSGAGFHTKDIIEAADNGFPWQVSIGASPGQLQRVAAGSSVTVNKKTFDGPVLVARGATLKEISFVSIGADEQASARIAATASQRSALMSDFDKWLQAKGIVADEISDAVRSTLQAAFDLEQAQAGEKDKQQKKSAGERMSSLLNEQEQKELRAQARVDITAKAFQDNPGQIEPIRAMAEQAEKGDWDRDRYELELLRAMRPQTSGRSFSRGDDGLTGQIIEAAVCLTGGLEEPEKHFNEQTLDAADKRWKHGLGLGELLTLFARRNGYDGLGTRDVRGLLKAAFYEDIRASGISTLSLPGILSNVANKMLKAGFDAVDSSWRAISAVSSVKDFREISSYALTGDFEYVELAPGGQIKHGTAGEQEYNNQAKTYARMFGIDRRDIINDDLNALTTIPRRLGRGAALKFNAVFWAEFMDNATFFTDARGNYNEGATPGSDESRLNIEGLTTADLLFRNQTDPDGKPFAVTPRILLVPNALAVTAANLMNSTELRNTTANTTTMNANPFAGQFTVIASPYLSNSSFTGYSSTAWYLLADPSDVPVIESVFLNGRQQPTVEQADADFNQLGIQMRGYHDFGVQLQEYRGGVKMKGAA